MSRASGYEEGFDRGGPRHLRMWTMPSSVSLSQTPSGQGQQVSATWRKLLRRIHHPVRGPAPAAARCGPEPCPRMRGRTRVSRYRQNTYADSDPANPDTSDTVTDPEWSVGNTWIWKGAAATTLCSTAEREQAWTADPLSAALAPKCPD